MTTKEPQKPPKNLSRKRKPTSVPPPPPPKSNQINKDDLISALIKFSEWQNTDIPAELDRLRKKDEKVKELLRRILMFLRELPDKKLPKPLYDEIFQLMANINLIME